MTPKMGGENKLTIGIHYGENVKVVLVDEARDVSRRAVVGEEVIGHVLDHL